VSCAKTAEPIDMPFGMWVQGIILNRVHIGATWRMPLITVPSTCGADEAFSVKLEIRSVGRGICPITESIMTDAVI